MRMQPEQKSMIVSKNILSANVPKKASFFCLGVSTNPSTYV